MKLYISLGVFGFVILVASGLYGWPRYAVYEQTLRGEAELARATYNRQVRVREAEASKEAAVQLAQAEIERAKGVAMANKIIGDSLKGNETYLHYLWIHGLQETKDQIIYIPTEAGLPILEAGRRKQPQPEAKP